ncbi:DUF3618 domain-containing protein [Leucobacter sp. cx-328]|uniref:DUF3618 domain-containing protein n=1 Tax=unclassified Leucobacter TaxID=2621730 RepID=UPI00165DDA6F|nr:MULTISPECIES: DUF3618 domain-containing protein [unclassified Leucobacter]MBC9944790.1 DUF3618 domain-containing protein [Leucobacter sp. cx-328]
MNQQERVAGVAEAQTARAELYDTLSLLTDRLNYAQRIDDAVDRTKVRFSRLREEKPVEAMAIVAGAAVAVGAVVWAVAAGLTRKR